MLNKLGFTCGAYLADIARQDQSIWVLDGDLADSDGAECFFRTHPSRSINAGIAEQNMISVAAGLAAVGKRPWVFTFTAFLCYRAYDQIRVSIVQTKLPVALVGSHAGGCGDRNGKTHLALNDIAVISSLPQIEIYTPSDDRDVIEAVKSTIGSSKPAYLRLPRDPQPLLPAGDGLIRWLGRPSKIAIVSYGLSSHWSVAAQRILGGEGIEIGVLHFGKIKPLNTVDLTDLFSDIKYAFVIEDHYEATGFVSQLRHIFSGINFFSIGWPASWLGQSGKNKDILKHYNLSAESIALRIKSFIDSRKTYSESFA